MDYSTSYRKDPRRKSSYRRNSAIKRQKLSSRVEDSVYPEPPPPTYARPSSHVPHEYAIPEDSRPGSRLHSYSQAVPEPSYTTFGAIPLRQDVPGPEDGDEDLPPRVHDTRRGRGHRDLLLRSQEVMDTKSPEVRDYMTICVYRNSTKRFDSCIVPLRTSRSGPNGKHRSLRSDPRSDRNFFHDLQHHYRNELTGRWRRFLGFKTVSTVRLLQFGDGLFYPSQSESRLFSPTFMAAFKKPDRYLKPHSAKWVIWLTNQKVKEEWLDLAIELKEDYDVTRIMAVAGFVLMSILLLSAIWLIKGGDAAYVSTVMSFVLTFVVAVTGLTGLWEFFDKGRNEKAYDEAVMDEDTLEEWISGDRGGPFGGRGSKA